MYGIVNKSLKTMVLMHHGEETWQKIIQKAGLEDGHFLSLNAYPDEITYDLVGAASEILNSPADQLLEGFGKHWATHTAVEEYSELMESGGDNFKSFLLNLPNFHTQIQLMLPKLNPPRFRCSDIQEQQLKLHYYSDRVGLEPFLEGIIQGLGSVFQCQVEIQKAEVQADDHCIYDIQWQNA